MQKLNTPSRRGCCLPQPVVGGWGGGDKGRGVGRGKGEMEGEGAAHFIGYPYPPRFTSIKAIYFYVKNSGHRTDRS